MRKVGSRELKNRLGTYLSHVGEGDVILVTDRGKPVARLVPVSSHARERPTVEGILKELAAAGHLRLATRPYRPRKPVPAKGKPASRMIVEDRR